MLILRFRGLMTLVRLEGGQVPARRCFVRTREIFEELKWHKIGRNLLRHLSMGMSNDFEAAIQEGATMVRIGSLLFGGASADHEEVEDGIDLDAQLRRKAAEKPS